jgi:hypothetical protein
MANKTNDETYASSKDSKPNHSSLWKLGLISASSALVGGIAVAWWHRKTLARLQNPIYQDDLRKSEAQHEVDSESEI